MPEVNYVAVLAAGVSSMVLGALWYGPLFGKKWISLMGWSQAEVEKKKKEGAGASYALGFVFALVTAFVLSHLFTLLGIADKHAAWSVVLWIWLGFYATITAGSVLWEGKKWDLWLLNNAYHVVNLLVVSTVLVALA